MFYKYFDEKLDLLLELTRECDAEMRMLIDEFMLIEPASPAGPGQLREWLGRYLPFHSRYLGIMRAWLEGTSRDPQMLAVVRETGHNMHLAALAVLGRVDRPYPLDPDIAAVIQGGILERMPSAAREQDPERPDSEIVSWQLPNGIETITLALARLGVVQNPLVMMLREREVGFICRQARSRWLLVPPAQTAWPTEHSQADTKRTRHSSSQQMRRIPDQTAKISLTET